MRRAVLPLAALLSAILLTACAAPGEEPVRTPAPAEESEPAAEEEEEPAMELYIGDTPVPVAWEGNRSAAALRELAAGEGLTVRMSMYGGFEQVGPLGTDIVREDVRLTTEPGDIVLYAGDRLVVFYGTNTWAYTRLGRIGLDREELTELLSHGDVTITVKVSK